MFNTIFLRSFFVTVGPPKRSESDGNAVGHNAQPLHWMFFTLDCSCSHRKAPKGHAKCESAVSCFKQVRPLQRSEKKQNFKDCMDPPAVSGRLLPRGKKISQRSETESDFCQNHTQHKDFQIYSLKCGETKFKVRKR